jgi:pimeloyl-ACP methyl ester carboxylesterase
MGMVWRVRVAVLLAAAVVGLAGGCDGSKLAVPPAGSAQTSPSLPLPAAWARCAADAAAGRQVRFGVAGATDLGGVVYGMGKVGVVLAHQAQATLCDWAAYGRKLAGRGYRALAFDLSGTGSSENASNDLHLDVDAAVAFLRGEGVDDVVLIGASIGGTGVLAAAAEIRPPVAGVISISAPRSWMRTNALGAAAKLSVPVLYVVGEHDGRFTEDTWELWGATPAAYRSLVVVDRPGHGVSLVKGEEGARKAVRAEMDAFIARIAPAHPRRYGAVSGVVR